MTETVDQRVNRLNPHEFKLIERDGRPFFGYDCHRGGSLLRTDPHYGARASAGTGRGLGLCKCTSSLGHYNRQSQGLGDSQ